MSGAARLEVSVCVANPAFPSSTRKERIYTVAVTLSKGANVSLSKEAPGLARIVVGLGWDTRSSDGDAFDLDASAFLLKEDGKVRSDADFIFYNNLKPDGGLIEHTGDNRTGEGDGDDESIKVNLASLPPDIHKVSIVVTIDQAEARHQNFGMVSQSFVRVVNEADGQEIVRYDLSEDFSVETALIFGEIYRHSGEWKFRAVGQGFKGGLGPLAKQFGVNV
jgi:tellurium resistance protein TerD